MAEIFEAGSIDQAARVPPVPPTVGPRYASGSPLIASKSATKSLPLFSSVTKSTRRQVSPRMRHARSLRTSRPNITTKSRRSLSLFCIVVKPDMYTDAARILGDRMSAEIAPGVFARRDALGGISLSTGDLRTRMGFEAEPEQTDGAPAVTRAVSPDAPPRPDLADPVAALAAHLPRPARADAVRPAPAPAPEIIRNPWKERIP